MGSVVAFPPFRSSGEARPARATPDRPGEVIILPVVQLLRPGTVPRLENKAPVESL